MHTLSLIGAFVVATLGGLACDGDSARSDVADTLGAEAVAGLAVTAAFETASPSAGQHHLTITVKNATGGGLAGATVTVVATMPLMGHGSTETPAVTDQGGGTYDAFPVTLQMPGRWKVEVEAANGGLTGSTSFDVDVQ